MTDDRNRQMSDADYHRLLQLAAEAQMAADEAIRNFDDPSSIAELEQRAASFRERAGNVRR